MSYWFLFDSKAERKEFLKEIDVLKEKPETFIEIKTFECKNKNLANYMKNYKKI